MNGSAKFASMTGLVNSSAAGDAEADADGDDDPLGATEADGDETAGPEAAAEASPASGDPPAGEAPGDPWFPVPHEATASAAARTSPRGARVERVIGRWSRGPPWPPRARARAGVPRRPAAPAS